MVDCNFGTAHRALPLVTYQTLGPSLPSLDGLLSRRSQQQSSSPLLAIVPTISVPGCSPLVKHQRTDAISAKPQDRVSVVVRSARPCSVPCSFRMLTPRSDKQPPRCTLLVRPLSFSPRPRYLPLLFLGIFLYDTDRPLLPPLQPAPGYRLSELHR